MTFASAEVSTHDGRPVRCYRFAHGATIWRYTSADQPITITDGTFTPEAIQDSAVGRGKEWDSGSMQLTLDRDNPIALLWQETRPREPVLVTVYERHRTETDQYPIRFSGSVANVSERDHSAILQCVPTSYRLKRRVPYLRYSKLCPLALYGSRCGLDKESFRIRVVLGSVNVEILQAAEFAAYADGWFTNGYVQTLDGETRFVVDHVGDLVTLEYPLGVVAAEPLDIYPGCDRTETTCSSKFSNLDNHLGFSHIPNRDLFGKAVE